MKERPAIKRLPRLLRGEVAGALTTLLWHNPKFSVVIGKKKKAVVFEFRVPVPDDLRRSYPALWELFFGAGIENWKKALSEAYWHANWGDKGLPHSLSNQLRVVFRDALGIWLKGSLAYSRDESKKEAQLLAFQSSSRTKRSQPDPWLAFWAAERFEALRTSIKELRLKLKKAPPMNDATLARRIQAGLPTVAPHRALGQICAAQGDGVLHVVFARISNERIAEAYIKCEMEDRHLNLGKPLLKTYIRLGNKIRETLSELSFS